uniref:Uncharacterized protein n=1 Tax=Romanomermis culicivorax TaxID=13658 RepID=A0A915HEK4_ROMCU
MFAESGYSNYKEWSTIDDPVQTCGQHSFLPKNRQKVSKLMETLLLIIAFWHSKKRDSSTKERNFDLLSQKPDAIKKLKLEIVSVAHVISVMIHPTLGSHFLGYQKKEWKNLMTLLGNYQDWRRARL